MILPAAMVANLTTAAKNLCEVGGRFGFTEDDMLAPDAGERILERIAQLEQTITLYKGMLNRESPPPEGKV